MKKDIITIGELDKKELIELVHLGKEIKENPEKYRTSLSEKTLLLLFQKTSTRTRLSFELGMKLLGGNVIVLDWEKSNFSISPLEYEAKYVSRVVDCIMARLLTNEKIVELAAHSEVPVINGCCNMFHPSQILGDLLTIYEIKGNFDVTITYVGVQNNVANSMFLACKELGINLIFVTPEIDSVPEGLEKEMEEYSGFTRTLNLEIALEKTDFLYTDTWINMEYFGKAEYASYIKSRIDLMLPYQITEEMIRGRDLYFMHDMPVHPGYEVDEWVLKNEKSVVYQQAENRLYSAQSLLYYLLKL